LKARIEVVEEAGDGDQCRAAEGGAGTAGELEAAGACGVGWHGRSVDEGSEASIY
jgi:hypothetical protein